MSLPESTDSVAFLPPSSKGAWSERRFALTMLGIITAITIGLLILARIQLSQRATSWRLPQWDMTFLRFLLAYRDALFAVTSMYLVWGRSPLFIRTLLAIAAVAITTHTYQVQYGHEWEALPNLAPYFISVLLMFLFWQLAFRLTGLRLYRTANSLSIVEHPTTRIQRWQLSLGQTFSVLFSVCLVLAFLRLLKYEYIQVMYQEDASLFPTECVSCLIIASFGAWILIPVRLWQSLVIVLPLLFGVFVVGVYFANWLWIGMPLNITFDFFYLFPLSLMALVFFCHLLASLILLLPFRLAGYRLAWKVPASTAPATASLHTAAEPPTS